MEFKETLKRISEISALALSGLALAACLSVDRDGYVIQPRPEGLFPPAELMKPHLNPDETTSYRIQERPEGLFPPEGAMIPRINPFEK